LKIEWSDRINCFLRDVIADVTAGKRPEPRSTVELHAKPKPMPTSKPKPKAFGNSGRSDAGSIDTKCCAADLMSSRVAANPSCDHDWL
jgi:hypothetical protein